MRLFIACPFVNCWEYTRDMLYTLKTSEPFHLLMLDNGSTDGSINSFRAEYSIIFKNWPSGSIFTYIYNPIRQSVSTLWNDAIYRARKDSECRYILIINNDILLHPKTIDNLIKFIDRTDYVMVTATNKNDGVFDKNLLNTLDPLDFDEFDLKPITNWREEGPDFSCFMIRPNFVDKVGWIDENYKMAYFEDNDTHTRIIKLGLHAKRVSTAPYFHYGSRTAANNPDIRKSINKQFELNRKYYIHKWGAAPSEVQDQKGHDFPFNDPNKPLWWWEGVERRINAE